MKSLARSAFLAATLSCVLIFIAWIIPCWFGRVYDGSTTRKLWGLFYVIECTSKECISVSRSLRNDYVDFRGATPPLRVEAITVLATISFVLSLLAMFIVIMFHCHACGRRHNYQNYVTSAVIVLITEATFVFLTIILSAVSNGVFFSKSPLKNGDEFPWSLFLFCLAEVMIVSSAVTLLLITCRWKKYRYIYTKQYHHHHSTALEPYHRHHEAIQDYRIETYDDYKPYYYDYPYGGYNDRIIPVDSGYYDKSGLPYKSMFGRTRYYTTYPYMNNYMDYSYVPERQYMPYYLPQSNFRSYWNSGLYDYLPMSTGLRQTPMVYDTAWMGRMGRGEPMFVNEPLLYTNDYHRTGQLYFD